jgi:ABC-type amino acid transport substrate-binding protein
MKRLRENPRLFRRIVASILCLILAAWFTFDWYRTQPNNDGTWARVKQSGVLRVGMDVSYPPFSNLINDKPVGIDIDIANEIGRRLGVRVEIANLGYDSLYDALKTGQVDVLISALSIDPTKLDKTIYSYPYINAGQVIGSVDGRYQTMKDLEERTVAVEYGSGGDELTRRWQRRLHQLNMLHFTTAAEAMNAVSEATSGRQKADAVIVDAITARLYLQNKNDLKLSQPVTSDPYCVAIRLASYDLAGAISDALKDMEQDGTLAAILSHWL